MRFELKLAWKYFRARRKSLARFTSLVAIVGIAAGVASLILAQALAKGFADEMRDKILANTAHISVSMRDGSEIFKWKDIKNELEMEENIYEVLPTTFENAIINGKGSANYAILRVSGKTNDRNDRIEVKIGAELADKSNIRVGDDAEITTFQNETAKTSKISVAEVFKTGLYEYDSTWVEMSPENYVTLTGKLRFTPSVMTISVRDIYLTDKTAGEIRDKLGDNFKVIDWQEANQPLFAALSLERKLSLSIIFLIIFIAALNITTTLSLLVSERRLDIAVLRTCGANTSKLLGAFLIEGLFLGSAGILFGVIFGMSGSALGNYFKVVKLPHEVYSLSYIPFNIDFVNVFFVILVSVFVCIAATIYPAYKASRIKPLENLRHQ